MEPLLLYNLSELQQLVDFSFKVLMVEALEETAVVNYVFLFIFNEVIDRERIALSVRSPIDDGDVFNLPLAQGTVLLTILLVIVEEAGVALQVIARNQFVE